MTGKELQQIRLTLCGTDTITFGRALCLCEGGKDASVAASVRRLEAMPRVPAWFAKMATWFAMWGRVA